MPNINEEQPFILWLFGIPGSGKSRIAQLLGSRIQARLEIVDSDELRGILTPEPNWTEAERKLFYRAIWEISVRLRRFGVSSIIAASGGGVALDEFQLDDVGRSFFVHVRCSAQEAFDRRREGW